MQAQRRGSFTSYQGHRVEISEDNRAYMKQVVEKDLPYIINRLNFAQNFPSATFSSTYDRAHFRTDFMVFSDMCQRYVNGDVDAAIELINGGFQLLRNMRAAYSTSRDSTLTPNTPIPETTPENQIDGILKRLTTLVKSTPVDTVLENLTVNMHNKDIVSAAGHARNQDKNHMLGFQYNGHNEVER